MVFIESRVFTRRLLELAGEDADDVLCDIQKDLLAKPDRGVMPPSLCGMRKGRTANPARGKGKRGGFRYMYLHLEKRHHIHLLFLLNKDHRKTWMPNSANKSKLWCDSSRVRLEVKNG